MTPAEGEALRRLMEQFLNGEHFYELMQAYRHTPLHEQQAVLTAFELVKSEIILAALAPLSGPVDASGEPQRWWKLYRALAWMVNDYIGISGISADFTQKDERLGYAHEGYHNARVVMRENKPPIPNGMQQGIRCKCWAKERGINAGTRHEHYNEPPYSCARCGCKAYEPASQAAAAVPSSPAQSMRQIAKAAFVEGFCAAVLRPERGTEDAWQESQAIRDSVARSAALPPSSPAPKGCTDPQR